jgi:hypothetical protein
MENISSEQEFHEIKERKKLSKQEMLENVSPSCININLFNNGGTIWKTCFTTLLSSIFTIFGVIQTLVPYVLSQLEINPITVVIVIGIFIAIFFAVFLISVKVKNFRVTQTFIYYAIVFVFSISGVLLLMSKLIPIDGYDVFKYFVILLPFSILGLVLSFYVTRHIVCN